MNGLGAKPQQAWTDLAAECENAGLQPNVENILTRIRMKIDAAGPSDEPLAMKPEELEQLGRTMRETIVKTADVPDDLIPADLPHARFATWVKSITRNMAIEVFTTNYDVLVERSLELRRVPVFDGFVGCYHPFFSPECMENEARLPDPSTVRLWKIHGSINWTVMREGNSERVVRDGVSEQGLMILPSNRKYDESRQMPYVAMLDRLRTVLAQEPMVLVTCGFSFGDRHINALLFEGLENHPSTHVIALHHGPLDEAAYLATTGSAYPNLIVIAENASVIGGKYDTWQHPNPLDETTATYVDLLFDTDTDGDGTRLLTGKMRAGDFSRLSTFLSSLQSARS